MAPDANGSDNMTKEYSKNRPSEETVVDVDPADLWKSSLSKSEMMKTLDEAEAAKKGDFQDLEADFWRAEKPGDFIQGVYVGAERGRKYLVHAIVKKDSKGKPYAVRVNGTAVLTRALKQVEPGTPVRIELTGFDKNDEGQPVNLYSIQTLKHRL